MITSEFEYYVLSHLIGMEDRELAQKVELHIWPCGPMAQPAVLSRYVEAMKASADPQDCTRLWAEIVDGSGLEFVNGDAALREKGFKDHEGVVAVTNARQQELVKFDEKAMRMFEAQEARSSDKDFLAGFRRMDLTAHDIG